MKKLRGPLLFSNHPTFPLPLSTLVCLPAEPRSHLNFCITSPCAVAIWVAYDLTNEEATGQVPRERRYYQDPDVRGIQADNSDYRGSGWDKGHMAPAGDMKWSEQAMFESCYFTNICPQNQNLNGGDWRILEEKCRALTERFDKLYIVCGPVVGSAKNGALGANRVIIPDGFYKVLLTFTGKNYQCIGFVFENKAGHSKTFYRYACSVDEVEKLTGIDFFSNLPDSIEEDVEGSYDLKLWGLK